MTNFSSPVRAATSRVNLIPNPSFEFDTTVASTSFAMPGSATLAVNTNSANALRGSNSLAVTCTTAGTVFVTGFGATAAASIAVTAGLSYSFSYRVKPGSVARVFDAYITWYTALGASGLSNVGGNNSTSVLGAWTAATVSGVAPAGALFATVGVRSVNTGLSEVNYIDGLCFEQAAAAGTFFDGTFDGSRWRGTAHNSISETYAMDAGSGPMQNVAAPLFSTDAANKSYVDAAVTAASTSGGGGVADTALLSIMGVY